MDEYTFAVDIDVTFPICSPIFLLLYNSKLFKQYNWLAVLLLCEHILSCIDGRKIRDSSLALFTTEQSGLQIHL